MFFPRVRVYIDNGWDKSRLKDPDNGIHHTLLLKENLDQEKLEVLQLLENLPDTNWTTNISKLPLDKIVHSSVENYFKNSNDAKHIKEGYTFSKTLKFETSGKPMRINLISNKYFILEGYTRPAMKTSKGISKGKGVYHCAIVYSYPSGEIIQARDYSCPAGKRGYCKHTAALAYKLVDCAMAEKDSLPANLTCTQIKKQWGLPSLRAEQDPEKERLKRQPLQNITFQRQILDRDLSGGRKRKLPNETLATFSSKPAKEPELCANDFSKLEIDLSKTINPSTLLLAIKAGRQSLQSSVESSTQQTTISSSYQTITTQQPKQGSSEWHDLRVGKITSSKIPSLIGLSGINEYKKAWVCISQKYREEKKSFPNFERGKFYEPTAANAFENASGIKLSESPLILHPSYPEHYGASPDRLFEVNSFFLKSFQTGELRELTGKYILEIKTRAIGSLKPLERVTASHICQCQLQMSCMPEVTASLLMSYLPETEEFTLFLIKRDNLSLERCSGYVIH